MYTLLLLLLLLLLILFILSNSEYYIPTPVVSRYQNYDWYNINNPNIGFAPAVHFIPPSRRECLQFVNQNLSHKIINGINYIEDEKLHLPKKILVT